MNILKRDAAVKKFKPMVDNQIPKEDLKTEILADEKGYTEDEANEIIEALFTPDKNAGADNNNLGNAPEPPIVVEEKVNFNKQYEEFGVELVKGSKLNDEGVYDDSCFEKLKITANRTTNISVERAEMLNAQSHNTKLRYYEVKS